MMNSPQYRHRFEAPPPPSLLSRIPWVKLVVLLALLGGGAWAYQHYVAQRQLPQEYQLTGPQGQPLPVRLEAHNESILKYTLLSDGTTHYVTIGSLAGDDQKFVQQLPATLKLNYPFECFMGEANAKPVLIRVLGHDANWVHYARLSDLSDHYVPLNSFSSEDQEILGQLPATLSLAAPLKITLHDHDGHALAASTLEGRSHDLAKLSSSDGTILYYPITELAPLDETLVDLLPANLPLEFPLLCTLTDNNGKLLVVRLEGRTDSLVKYSLLNSNSVHYAFNSDFSRTSREFLSFLPASLSLTLPLEDTLTDANGQPLHVRIDARNEQIVKFNLIDTGVEYYWPPSAFSAQSRQFFALLPSGLKLELPIDTELKSAAGTPLQVHLFGRGESSVQFTTTDGKSYDYPIGKFSDDSQAFLKLLPLSPQAKTPALTAEQQRAKSLLTELRSRLAGLMNDDTLQQRYIDDNGLTMTTQMDMDNTRNQMDDVCKQIDSLLDKTSQTGQGKIAQTAWERVMSVVKRDDGIRHFMSDATGEAMRQAQQGDLRKSQEDLVAALREIYLDIGAYTP